MLLPLFYMHTKTGKNLLYGNVNRSYYPKEPYCIKGTTSEVGEDPKITWQDSGNAFARETSEQNSTNTDHESQAIWFSRWYMVLGYL